MTRLDELVAIRDQIDAEIARERAALQRTALLRAEMLRVTTRATWNERVLAVTCHHYGVDVAVVLDGRRGHNIVDARHTAMWLMRDSGRSFPEIATALGMHHTSVMHGLRRVTADPRLLATAHTIREQLTGQPVPSLKVVAS